MSDVLVAGCGLLGTSIGLALRGSTWDDVTLWDLDAAAVRDAVERGAGRPWDGAERAGLAVVCVPPGATAAALLQLQRRDVASTYTHVTSVQAHVQAHVEALSPVPSAVLGGHPLAGREIAGAAGAVADLFVGRPWALCRTPRTGQHAYEAVRRLAELCGAVPVDTTPEQHDAAVALTSHLPQVAASALAGALRESAHSDTALPMELSGPGLADTTRLAASDAGLWTDVLTANAAEVAPRVRALGRSLDALAGALEVLADGGTAPASSPAATGPAPVLPRPAAEAVLAVRAFLARGNEGRALVPVKRGVLAEAFVGVRVELADAPGELARLLVAAGEAGVNVEDLRLEHVPGRDRGVAELLVAGDAHPALTQALTSGGWRVFMSTKPS